MKRAASLAIVLLALAAPLQAQTGPSEVDPRDKIAPKEMSYREDLEPWWMALADCAAIFQQAPMDRPKMQTFATAAMAQMAKDRGITVRQAGAIVMPHVMTGRGFEIASAMVAVYDGVTRLRTDCDGVMAKYKTL